MPPHRNALERRSSREPATQHVSETHDHKPDVPGSEPVKDGAPLFVGLRFELDEIVMGMNVLTAKVRDLNGCFEHRQEVSAKVAADDICKVASQVSLLAGHMSAMIAKHVNRKPRVSE